jgi:L-amino acid N-acyltransferase YncA
MMVHWDFSDFRKMGFGLDILLSLMQKRNKDHKPVFGNIMPDNLPSIKLVSKLGFKLYRSVSWIKLK